MQERAHPKSNIVVILALFLLVSLSVYLWLNRSSTFDSSQVTSGSAGPDENSSLAVADSSLTESSSSAQRSGNTNIDVGSLDNGDTNAQFSVSMNVLLEIGFRISVEQMADAENELLGLVTQLNELTDEEKLDFLTFFVDQMVDAPINPESIVAFEQLWSQLDKSDDTDLAASQILGPHYTAYYENTFAINHFENIVSLGAELNSSQQRDLSNTYFRMHQYTEAIPLIHEYIEEETGANREVQRLPFSQLFEAYYRTGSLAEAEVVGLRILEEYNELQDWKDMQQFYESIGDANGLELHINNAKEQGVLGSEGQWMTL